MAAVTVGIIGDYDHGFAPHRQTDTALQHAGKWLGVAINSQWLATNQVHDWKQFDGLWCAPGSPYRSLEGALAGIRFAREQGKPLLGTCGGFQHIVLEYARHVMGFTDAAHAEYDPYASRLFIRPLSCSMKGKSLPILLEPHSLAARAYCSLEVEEAYYCDFGLNSAYQEQIQEAGLRVTGFDADREARIVEIADHPFYLGSLFVPQARSTENAAHPLICAFVKAVQVCLNH